MSRLRIETSLPDWHGDLLILPVIPHNNHLLGGGGDGVNGAHEHVRHHEDPEEAVDDAGCVKADPNPDWPATLEEEREHHPLHGAGVLVGTDGLPGLHVADVGVVARPVPLHVYHLYLQLNVISYRKDSQIKIQVNFAIIL